MRWFFRLRVYIIIFLAVMLISAAVLFSVLRAVLPHATGYKNEIQQEISQQLGLPVEIDSIDAAIHWFSPRLKLIHVSVFDEKYKVPLFNFRQAFVELDVIASILRQEIIIADVGLIGADISIEKLSESEWMIQGIKFTSEGSSELPDKFLYMIQNADYLLHDSNIYYQDHTGEKLNISLLDVNIDVENSFNNHDIKFSMNLPEAFGKSLVVVANLSGEIESLDGDVYIEAHQLKLKKWNEKFKLLKTHQVDAILDINLWVTLENNDVQTLSTHLISNDLSIKNVVTAKSWKTDFVSSNIRYVYDDDHWNVVVTDFYFGKELKAAWGRPITIMASDDDDHFYLSADFLRVNDLQLIAEAVLTKDSLSDLEKVKAYQLQADIYNLNVRLPKDTSKDQLLDKLYLDASIVDFSMHAKADEIAVTGIDASLLYDKHRAEIDMVTHDSEFELKKLFRAPLFFETISGTLTLAYLNDSWKIRSNRLQLKNSHINTFSRLNIEFSSAENIFIDAQTDFYDAYGKYASQYLPVGVMSDELVDWLDMAVTDGYVPSGTFILHGNLSDFPYHEKNGIFQVLFSAQDINMQFLEDWPLLTDASAVVKFNNLSLVVSDAKGKTHDAELYNGFAEIKNLTDPYLTVATDAHGKNDDIQSYVWSSPLREFLGASMRLFQFEGESDLNLKIDVPLNMEEIEVVIDGHLNFIDSVMYYPELGYEVTDINGVVAFTSNSVFADSINAKIQNKPIIINAFTRDGDSGNEVVFHLDGVVAADYLLQQYDWIPKDWISGESKWAIDIEIPYEPDDYLVHINANSYLNKVAIQVSDKVQKAPDRQLSFAAEIDVLENDGLHVEAIIKDNLDLYAVRDENKLWNFDIKSGYITGKGAFTEGLDKDTQVKLDLENVNLHALFVSENQKQSQSLRPVDFPPLNWNVKKVLWDDWVFTDVKVETNWHKHGMLINTLSLNGPAMTFDARGTWLTSWSGAHETVLQGDITSSNFGETLTGLGFERSIDRSKYKATFESKWPAEPYSLSWRIMKGKTVFEMKEGEILEVDPGAGGRILGLLNIFKLANRLVFDFDDVTREGFSFDTINGEFEFVNGDGSLKNFNVSAAAADINMFGSIGLINRDYGLLMRVKPHTDTLTFAGTALLGGVVVGAGIALIQKVFDLGVIGHNVYSITGSWDDPEIEKIVEKTPGITEEDDY
jgi:uncharacterized protein YhdP